MALQEALPSQATPLSESQDLRISVPQNTTFSEPTTTELDSGSDVSSENGGTIYLDTDSSQDMHLDMAVYGEPSFFRSRPEHTVRDNVIYTNDLQFVINKEWVPVRRDEISAATISEVLKEKSKELFAELDRLSPEEMEGVFADEKRKDALVRKMAYTVAGTVDLMTKIGLDVDQLMIDKQEVIELKYNDALVRELRFYGPDPDNPRRMTAPQAMDYLKANYIDGVQHYQLRGLPVPEEKPLLTEEEIQTFGYLDQRFAARWQNNGFGAENFTVDRIRNMRGESAEMLAEIDATSDLNALTKDSDAAKKIGLEGIDYIFGLLGVVSNWKRDFKPEFEEAVKHMKEKYAPAVKVARKTGKPLALVFGLISDTERRVKKGLQPSYAAILAGLVR